MAVEPHINLLQGRKEAVKRQRVAFAKIQFIVVAILIGYCVLLVGVLGVRGFIAAQQRSVGEDISKEELALAGLKSIEEKYVLVSNKLKLISDYLKSRGRAREALLAIYQSLPEGVTLSQVELGGDEDSLSIRAQARDMQTILNYLNLVQNDVSAGVYRQIALSGLNRASNGSYVINSEYSLGK